MKPKLTRVAPIILCVGMLLVLISPMTAPTTPAAAQSGGTYTITWYTIDGGGGVLTGGAYTLTGTIGQPDAGVLSGGVYTLAGGFWNALSGAGNLFLPFIKR